MQRIFVTNLLHVHSNADRERIQKILDGQRPEAEHFVVLEKGSVWADMLNPGDDVQVEFGYGDKVPVVGATCRVLATEKRRTEDISREHANLNLGPTNLGVIIEKQFGFAAGFRVDFVSILHLTRKGGPKRS